MKLYKIPPIKLSRRRVCPDKIWDDDVLYRKDCAKLLTSLLSDGSDPIVVGINGEWGSGKTFFLERWVYELRHNKYAAIYYNAWDDDSFDDPLISIVGQLAEYFKGSDTLKEIKDVFSANRYGFVKDASIAIVSSLIRTYTGIDFGNIKKSSLSTPTENLLDIYVAKTAAKKELRRQLAKLASDNFKRTGRYLVLVVDELDRCNPSYAVKLLERSKHILNVPYLAVVLGIDKVQLSHSIKAVYGNIDAENYLHRFIDVDFSLPAPDLTEYMNFLWRRYRVEEYFTECEERKTFLTMMRRARTIMSFLCKMHQLSLREVEVVFKTFILLFRTHKKRHDLCPELIAALIILKVISPQNYRLWMNEVLPVHKVVDVLIPVEDECNFPQCKNLVAALYATHYQEPAAVAFSCNKFLKVISDKKFPADEIHCPYPKVLRHESSKNLIAFSRLVKRFRSGYGLRCKITFKEMNKIACMMEFVSGDYINYKGLKDGVAKVDKTVHPRFENDNSMS